VTRPMPQRSGITKTCDGMDIVRIEANPATVTRKPTTKEMAPAVRTHNAQNALVWGIFGDAGWSAFGDGIDLTGANNVVNQRLQSE